MASDHVRLASADPARAAEFYVRLFGWDVPTIGNADSVDLPALNVGVDTVALAPERSSRWIPYFDTPDLGSTIAEAVEWGASNIEESAGRVSFDDPAGATVGASQEERLTYGPSVEGSFAYPALVAELDQVISFYASVLGFKSIPIEGDEFGAKAFVHRDRVRAIAVAAELPGSWIALFNVSSVDSSFSRAIEMGARAFGEPFDTEWDRSVVLEDPTGARFGLTSSVSLAGALCCHAIPRRIGHAGCDC